MTRRQLERLSDLLLKLHEEKADDGRLRDQISAVRHAVNEELDNRPLTYDAG